jgi:3-hydroxybutyryl-CoA dehydratase
MARGPCLYSKFEIAPRHLVTVLRRLRHGQLRLFSTDRLLWAVGRRDADRSERDECDHLRIDRARADQCGTHRRIVADVPAPDIDGSMDMLTLRTLSFEDLSVGMTERLSKTVASSDVVGFAEVTGDRNPIHLSEHFAAKTPFGTRIAHGLYTASLISALLGTRLPGPGAVYISQTLNFRAPVKIGDTVEVSVVVAELMPEKFRARLACTCSVAGEIVLDGEAWVKVPSKEAGGRPLPRV